MYPSPTLRRFQAAATFRETPVVFTDHRDQHTGFFRCLRWSRDQRWGRMARKFRGENSHVQRVPVWLMIYIWVVDDDSHVT